MKDHLRYVLSKKKMTEEIRLKQRGKADELLSEYQRLIDEGWLVKSDPEASHRSGPWIPFDIQMLSDMDIKGTFSGYYSGIFGGPVFGSFGGKGRPDVSILTPLFSLHDPDRNETIRAFIPTPDIFMTLTDRLLASAAMRSALPMYIPSEFDKIVLEPLGSIYKKAEEEYLGVRGERERKMIDAMRLALRSGENVPVISSIFGKKENDIVRVSSMVVGNEEYMFLPLPFLIEFQNILLRIIPTKKS